ncbi:MAG: uridine kinase [Armatimonadia bacterium]|nr:uridine kinase [Armatimonadia bacterium]
MHLTDRTVRELLGRIRAVRVDGARPRVVAIDGGGGAGKSTLAERLEGADEGVACVRIDDFYRPAPEPRIREETCWFFDWRRLRDRVLIPAFEGESVSFRPYDWSEGELSDEELHLGRPAILVVEGISTLRRELRDWVDFGIWVEAPAALRLERGLERDGDEARDMWVELWMPEEERYFESHRPAEYADVKVSGSPRG